jgi:hypothetical protein
LADLTYLECELLSAKLLAATDADAIFAEIKTAHKSCTLMQPNEIDPLKAGCDTVGAPVERDSTWKSTSELDRKRVRIDLSKLS